MSPTSDLLTGLAQFLADQGVVTYRADSSAYAASETGVVFGLMPQTPDRVVCLTDYPVNDDAANPWSQVRVQIR
ncbi:MAG TPA: minor capsid protein, partial [Mycobacteriales bacterium]|nr:minor capsid protein [Mycobacteriales bacterium]